MKKLLTSIIVFISRFGYLPANFSIVGSFGFFGGNFLLYFFSIVLFDIIKGGFYSGFLFTYLGFLSYWIFGKMAKNMKSKMILLPAASFVFFLVSNFGVWWHWYPHTVSGLTTCYSLAIPFYKNTLFGDLFFGYGFMAFTLFVKLLSKKSKPVLETSII
jgi:hypothetical protein